MSGWSFLDYFGVCGVFSALWLGRGLSMQYLPKRSCAGTSAVPNGCLVTWSVISARFRFHLADPGFSNFFLGQLSEKNKAYTLLTSTFVFRSGGFPFRGFELEWSLVATSLEGFSATSHEKKGTKGPFFME